MRKVNKNLILRNCIYLFLKFFIFVPLLKAKRDTRELQGVLSFKAFPFTDYSVKQIFFSL